ncbi:MAG: WecB/TagA/CpsF family glycosyltransferase [Patescibacteria group bacterium]
MNKQIKILDIKINILSKIELLEKIKELLQSNRQKQLVTTNPEFIIEAQKNQEFKNILNSSWLSVADGYGIRLASKYCELATNFQFSIFNFKININFKFQKIIINFLRGLAVAWWGITKNNKRLDIVKEIITGVDLMQDIASVIPAKAGIQLKIFLLGGYGNTPKLVAKNLKKINNNLKIDYCIFEGDNKIDKINNFQPEILFVALNHPKAQIWINNNLAKMPSVKLAIGVGGAFDYISGKVKRAPKNWLLSYEWLYRLFKQPKRIKRIFNACVKFPWAVFSNHTNKSS